MRSGALKNLIEVQKPDGEQVDDFGTPVIGWSKFVTLRAEVIRRGAKEFLEGGGGHDAETVIFRTRMAEGITGQHRVLFGGAIYNIEEVSPLGRRAGLELGCTAERKA